MRKAYYILLFCVGLVLPLNTSGSVGSSSDQGQGRAHLQPVEHNSSQDRPQNNANRFRIPHQGESGISVLSRPSSPDSLHELPDYSYGMLPDDVQPTHPGAFYFAVAQNLERSLIIKKLIFPFHTFL